MEDFSKHFLYYFSQLIVSAYVLNQSHGHWLLFVALHVAISMALKLRKKLEWHPFMANLMEDMAMALKLFM